MLGGMNILGKFLIFCLGVPIGIYIAFYIVIAGEDEKGIGRVAAFIEAPLFWISQTLSPPNSGGGAAGCFMLLHFSFWGVLGGLFLLGVVTLKSKISFH